MPTDKQRLDWLQKAAQSATPGGWFSVNYDGAVIREDAAGNKDDYAPSAPTIRRAIDLAMKSDRKSRGREEAVPLVRGPVVPKAWTARLLFPKRDRAQEEGVDATERG